MYDQVTFLFPFLPYSPRPPFLPQTTLYIIVVQDSKERRNQTCLLSLIFSLAIIVHMPYLFCEFSTVQGLLFLFIFLYLCCLCVCCVNDFFFFYYERDRERGSQCSVFITIQQRYLYMTGQIKKKRRERKGDALSVVDTCQFLFYVPKGSCEIRDVHLYFCNLQSCYALPVHHFSSCIFLNFFMVVLSFNVMHCFSVN